MGICTYIHLPDNVRFDDVAKVVAIAAGLQPEFRTFAGQPGSGYVRVPGIDAKNSLFSAGIGEINFDGRHALYHFESSYGGRLLNCGGSQFWCAVGRRLVDFFGGYVDYNDCDDIAADYKRRPKSRAVNAPTSDSNWMKFQNRLMRVKRIHMDELSLTPDGDQYKGEGGYMYTFDEDGLMTRCL